MRPGSPYLGADTGKISFSKSTVVLPSANRYPPLNVASLSNVLRFSPHVPPGSIAPFLHDPSRPPRPSSDPKPENLSMVDQRARNAAAEAMASLASAPAVAASAARSSPALVSTTLSGLSPAGSLTPPPPATTASVSISPSSADQHSHNNADKYSDYDRHFMKKFFGSERRTRCDSSHRDDRSSAGTADPPNAVCSSTAAGSTADELRDSISPHVDPCPPDLVTTAAPRDTDTSSSAADSCEPVASKRIHLESDRLSPPPPPPPSSTRPSDSDKLLTVQRPLTASPANASNCAGDELPSSAVGAIKANNNVVDRPGSSELNLATSTGPVDSSNTDRTDVTDR